MCLRRQAGVSKKCTSVPLIGKRSHGTHSPSMWSAQAAIPEKLSETRNRNASAPARACEIHGLAGVLAEEKYGNASMTARDIVEMLPEAFRRLQNRRDAQP